MKIKLKNPYAIDGAEKTEPISSHFEWEIPKPIITKVENMTKGVGGHLKDMLSWFEPPGGCEPCNQKANILDVNGPDWAEQNIDTVTEWLMQNARSMTSAVAIPGISHVTQMVAKDFVRRAIAKTREEQTNAQK